MDVALEFLDPLIFDQVYAWALPYPRPILGNSSETNNILVAETSQISFWDRNNIYRQCISILLITQLGASTLYLLFSGLSYHWFFDRRLELHPKFLKNQVRQEIRMSLTAIPFINIMTLPWFLAEVRGYSLLYSDIQSYGWGWLLVSSLLYMVFNDVGIYWIHRLEHHPSIYKYIHKPHHKWISQFSDIFRAKLC